MRRAEGGFTLIEVLIALVVFAIVAIGALAALGATTASGFLGAFPTSFATVRMAKDNTAAVVYGQALQEYVTSQPTKVPVGCYWAGAGAPPSCPGFSVQTWPPGTAENPDPPPAPTLASLRIEVSVQPWSWNGTAYALDPGCTSDCLYRIQTVLTWEFRGAQRPVLTLTRFRCTAGTCTPP